MRLVSPLLLIPLYLLPNATVAAQSPVHRIPEQGAALYDRVARGPSVGCPAEAALPRHAGAAVLLASDLDRRRRRVEGPVASLFELGARVAFDLTTHNRRKSFTLEVAELYPYGALRLQGKSGPVGIDGAQPIEVAIEPVTFTAAGRKRGSVTGDLHVVRHFDPKKGLVSAFSARLVGEMSYPSANGGPSRKERFEITDSWQLREVVENRTPKFRAAVNAAIRNGARYLKQRIGGNLRREFAAGRGCKDGELALILLALLRAGESPQDPVIQNGLAELKSRRIEQTYPLSVALLALEACYTPANERQDILSGRLKSVPVRTPTPEDRELMQEWTNQLLRNRAGGPNGDVSRWSYEPSAGPKFDNSNTQYAILGLYAAHLCGIDVEDAVWAGAARHYLNELRLEKKRTRLRLTTHRQARNNSSRTGTSCGTEIGAWAYDKRPTVTGSMTVAAIASLTICNEAMGRRRRPADVASGALRAAVRSGYAWLAEHYTVRHNPGFDGDYWHRYYLYGLERACELGQITLIQGHDWYFDGATLLLEEQLDSGKWNDGDVDTCFAILFLKKAPLPAVTSLR